MTKVFIALQMAYLQTVVTYHQPSEAEVDKAFLESHGIDVCLLNANTARNELGPAFYIQLQVPADQYATAIALLKEINPSRFGSAERVAEIEREILRGVIWFFVPAAIFAVVGFVAASESPGFDLRVPTALSSGGLAGIVSLGILKLRRRGKAPRNRDVPSAASNDERAG